MIISAETIAQQCPLPARQPFNVLEAQKFSFLIGAPHHYSRHFYDVECWEHGRPYRAPPWTFYAVQSNQIRRYLHEQGFALNLAKDGIQAGEVTYYDYRPSVTVPLTRVVLLADDAELRFRKNAMTVVKRFLDVRFGNQPADIYMEFIEHSTEYQIMKNEMINAFRDLHTYLTIGSEPIKKE